MKRRSFLGTAAAVSLVRPALAQPAIGSGDKRVLRFIPEGNLSNPDPVWTTTTIARNHGMMIWDTLYGTTTKGEVKPQMVAGHTLSADKLTWTFTLRDGLNWHDGERVLAKDCVPSIMRWAKRRGFGQKMLTQLAGMRAIDDKTFEIRLTKPYPLMLDAFGTECFMMPERIAKTDAFTQITEYVGSGPFKFLRDEWVSGAKAVYARNDKYVPVDGAPDFTAGAKVANFDRVEWIVVPDPATAAGAMQRGEVDWWQNPIPDLLPQLKASPGVNVMLNDTIGVIAMIAFNHIQPPWNNPKLLRAILPAIDQNEFMQTVWGDAASFYHTPCGVFTPGLPMGNLAGMEALSGKRDVALAKRLVAESGYKGEKIVLMSPSDYPLTSALCQMTNDVFTRCGLNVEYASTDWGTLVSRRTSREPVEKGGWSNFCTTYEGLSVANPASHFPIRGNGFDGWFGWPTSPRIEGLRDAWFDAPDLPAQKHECEEIQKAVWDEVPFIPVGQWYNPTATRANLVDVVKAPYPIFWGARKI